MSALRSLRGFLKKHSHHLTAASAAGALALFCVYRQQCRDMNPAERHCTLDVALYASIARRAPMYGAGVKPDRLHWRDHLLGSFTPHENARELLAIVGLPRSAAAALTPELATEATRRLLRYLSPFRSAEGPDWSREECRAIAASLLSQLGGAAPFLASSGSDGDGDGEAAPLAVRTQVEVPLPTLMPWWMRISNRVGNLAASWAVCACGFKSTFVDCPQQRWRLHFYDSLTPSTTGAPPMLLIHGMFTTAVSMGAIGALLRERRRVIILDLPDFDFGFSRTTTSPGKGADEPRAGLLAQHADAIEWLAAKLVADSDNATGQIDLVGHSYGAHLCAIAARRLGPAVRHVHLLAPAGVGASIVIGPLSEPLRALDKLPSLAQRAIAPVLLAVLRSPNALNFFVAMFRQGKRYWEGMPLGPHCRAHIVVGDWDDIVLPRPAAQMAQNFPRGEGWMVRGGRHQMIVLSAAAVSERIEAFAAQWSGDSRESGSGGAPSLRHRAIQLLLHFTNARVDPLFDNSAVANGGGARESCVSESSHPHPRL